LLVDWPDRDYKLIVAVAVRIGDERDTSVLLFDPACEYCVISQALARAAGWQFSLDLPAQGISTRLGHFDGVIDRMALTFVGVDDEELPVDATWMIIADWPGPTVLGWRGCLERMRFAVDPLDNWFYFAAA
jgi:hypothetical protein